MNRTSVLVTTASVILLGLLIALAPPAAAQEKNQDPTGKQKPLAGRQPDEALSTAGTEAGPNQPAPVIYFPEPLHDFGTVPRGSKVSHNFRVINNGDAPLKLIKAKGS